VLRNDLDAFWLPFTPNREFKANPRLFVAAKGMHYTTSDGRQVMDGTSGLWCCAAGHGRPEIAEAIGKAAMELDYAPAFQMAHPRAFELATRLAELAPGKLNHVFFTNSGSESVETALKIALGYHRARGEGQRHRLIGRERAYHGVNFGGMSVGGMTANRKAYSAAMLPGVDHLRHTDGLPENLFSKGQPEHGAWLADDLERLCALHDPSTIAAVIVEPLAGSAGVLLPPKGYLQRLREICDKHGILLIFDEVITGYGRLGAPFAAQYFGVEPDIMTTAKAITNGIVPMGAVFASDKVHDAFMTGPEHVIEFFHGYTFTANPVACAAAMAALNIYEKEGLFERVAELAPYWQEAIHSLKDRRHVRDIRNLGLIGAVDLEPISGAPTKRVMAAFRLAYERGLLLRTTGDIVALCPPLIVQKSEIDWLIDTLGGVLDQID
jgi:beta-alanine--pyruvate transaminase